VCLVFATQRSGSTAFCRAVKQTGIFGRPKEVFLNNMVRSREDVFRILEATEFPENSRTGSAKIMLSQTLNIANALCGNDYDDDHISAVKAIVDALSAQCQLATFGIIRDEALEIAISLGFANMSGVWHLDNEVERHWSDADIAQVAAKANQALPRVLKETALLKELSRHVPEIIWYDYDYCAERNFRISDDIVFRSEQRNIWGGRLSKREKAVGDDGMYKKIVNRRDQERVMEAMDLISTQSCSIKND